MVGIFANTLLDKTRRIADTFGGVLCMHHHCTPSVLHLGHVCWVEKHVQACLKPDKMGKYVNS